MPRGCRVLVAALWAGGLASAAAQPADSGPSAAPVAEVRTVTLRYALRLSNPTAQPIPRPELTVFAPTADSPRHRLLAVRSNERPVQVPDADGNTTLQFALSPLAPYANRLVWIETEVELRDRAAAGSELDSAAFLGAEPLLEADDADLRSLAAQLQRATPAASARAVFEWTRDHLRYEGYVAEARGAREALRRASGDCTEYAYLSAALARALGVPARVVGGFVVSGPQRLRATDYHDWTEVHVDGRWLLLDAQRGVFDPPAGAGYVAFERRSAVAGTAAGQARRFAVSAPVVAEME